MVPPPPRFDRSTWLALLLVTIAAYLIYVWGFDYPAVPFWDERYYIVDAQKYLHGVYFIDLHPPLGKLLVTLGEKLFGRNAATDQFLGVTYYAETIPPGFSFVGFRFFPVLLAWLTAPLLFLLFLTLVRDRVLAMLLCGLYLFDNALVVHLRGALLEGPLLFFTVSLLLAFVWLIGSAEAASPATDPPPDGHAARAVGKRSSPSTRRYAVAVGLALGCVLTTKSIGAVFAALPLIAIWRLRSDRRRAIESALIMGAAALAVVVTVWEVHFMLARRVNPVLLENGYYVNPSNGARAFLASDRRLPLTELPALIRDALRYARWYDSARPPIDFCKPDEKASPFWMWPIGARAVAYWWDTADNGRSFRYLYLQVNPVVWWTALGGVVIAVSLLIASAVAAARPLKNRFLLTVVTALYLGYFAPFPWIHGVMFLYHYFIPLILSFVLVALVDDEVMQLGRWPITIAQKRAVVAVWLVGAIAVFWVYKPLTYYERPLTPADLQRRAILPLWDLRCVACPHTDGLCTSTNK